MLYSNSMQQGYHQEVGSDVREHLIDGRSQFIGACLIVEERMCQDVRPAVEINAQQSLRNSLPEAHVGLQQDAIVDRLNVYIV